MEDEFFDTPMFCELVASEDNPADESNIRRLRQLLEARYLRLQILVTVNSILTTMGLLFKNGAVVDATLIAAQFLENRSGKCDF